MSIGRVMEKAKTCLGRSSNPRSEGLVQQESRSKNSAYRRKENVIYVT
jgi:hypothetical protein